MTIVVSLLVLILVTTNVVVTVVTARAYAYTRNQKLAQCAIVWLVPIVGAVLVYAVLRSGDEAPKATSHHIPETNTEGEYAGQSHGTMHGP